jgi:hypothetical protein
VNSKFKCTGCKEYFLSEHKLKINSGTFHTFECAAAHGRKKADKLKEKQSETKHKALKKKVSDNDKSGWTKKAQQIFNKYIRLRDVDLPCISCRRFHTGKYDAGHYRTVGSSPELRFNEDNNHKQCQPCNRHLSANLVNYRINLIRKIGEVSVAEIEGHHPPKRYTIANLKTIQKWYKRKTQRLQREDND